MDILMVYWNSVWRSACDTDRAYPKGPTEEEWAAFYRQMNRRAT